MWVVWSACVEGLAHCHEDASNWPAIVWWYRDKQAPVMGWCNVTGSDCRIGDSLARRRHKRTPFAASRHFHGSHQKRVCGRGRPQTHFFVFRAREMHMSCSDAAATVSRQHDSQSLYLMLPCKMLACPRSEWRTGAHVFQSIVGPSTRLLGWWSGGGRYGLQFLADTLDYKLLFISAMFI